MMRHHELIWGDKFVKFENSKLKNGDEENEKRESDKLEGGTIFWRSIAKNRKKITNETTARKRVADNRNTKRVSYGVGIGWRSGSRCHLPIPFPAG